MIDIMLLLALPASGKSEIRRYLDHLDAGALADLSLGGQVHVDDYPYVHLMRRISGEMASLGAVPMFFTDSRSQFTEQRDWLTLTLLLDEDIRDVTGPPPPPGPAAPWLFDRMDSASEGAGIGRRFDALDSDLNGRLADAVEPDAAELRDSLPRVDSLDGRTLVVEFARGGPEGAVPPLESPFGFANSLAAMSSSVLVRSAIVHVAVSPAESRRRNLDRARPGPEGDASILHHGVPEAVMRGDYGTEDLSWMIMQSPLRGTVSIAHPEGPLLVPAARLDNEDDLTSHLRGEVSEWDAADTAELHHRLVAATTALNEEV
ncbi:hypothetical protein HQ535_03565 [bacterium]|nr:hypothetical protein [bacterium]